MKPLFIILVHLFSAILSSSVDSRAQEFKLEKEERISSVEMPERALEMLEPLLEETTNIKYYVEKDGERISYECKFKFNNSKFSVEFNESGRLEDVEFVVTPEDLPIKTRNALMGFLEDQYDRFKIKKFQKQYSSDNMGMPSVEIIARALNDDEDGMIIRYELEVDGKQDRKLVNHELLFDQEGLFIRKRTIIRRQVDNILY